MLLLTNFEIKDIILSVTEFSCRYIFTQSQYMQYETIGTSARETGPTAYTKEYLLEAEPIQIR